MGLTMELLKALHLEPQTRLALVGAGGKTTALFQLARQYLDQGAQRVILSASTHLSLEQAARADHHYQIENQEQLINIKENVPAGTILFTGPVQADQRTSRLDKELLNEVLSLADQCKVPLLVEADGSRRRPLKAPADHEPPIPEWVDTVVVVAGLSGIGKLLGENWVFRPEIFSTLAGESLGSTVTWQSLEEVLLHPNGGLKNIPVGARRVALLNQAERPELQAGGAQLASRLVEGGYDTAVVAALEPPAWLEQYAPQVSGRISQGIFLVRQPLAAVILAAGGSTRLGQPKQLLKWRGEALVRHAAISALQAGLQPVILVTGAFADQVQSAVTDLPLVVAYNRDWAEGQSTSLKTGLQNVNKNTGGVIFLLSDQPQTPVTLLESLMDRHGETLAPIIAPLVDGQRGNPVLFDRQTFPDLFQLQGDTGGRALFQHYPVSWLPWHDPAQLLDIDRPEDYQRLLDMA